MLSISCPQVIDPDHDLVARACNRDTHAFDALILKYGDKIYALVYNMTSHREDTHDLLQEIFTKAYEGLRGFRGNSTFYTWLYQIATNTTLNFLKKRNRRTGLSLNDIDLGAADGKILIDPAPGPEQQIRLKELQKRLNESMQRLSHNHRMIVTMFDIQGMSHSDIARILEISEGTVRSRLHYAHLQLQSLLQKTWTERF